MNIELEKLNKRLDRQEKRFDNDYDEGVNYELFELAEDIIKTQSTIIKNLEEHHEKIINNMKAKMYDDMKEIEELKEKYNRLYKTVDDMFLLICNQWEDGMDIELFVNDLRKVIYGEEIEEYKGDGIDE